MREKYSYKYLCIERNYLYLTHSKHYEIRSVIKEYVRKRQNKSRDPDTLGYIW